MALHNVDQEALQLLILEISEDKVLTIDVVEPVFVMGVVHVSIIVIMLVAVAVHMQLSSVQGTPGGLRNAGAAYALNIVSGRIVLLV